MKYTYPLIAINIDTSTILLYTREDVIAFIDKYGKWHEHHRYWHSWYDWKLGIRYGEYLIHEWIVRDDRGRKVDHRDFFENYSFYYYNKSMAKIRSYAEKGLPIPGTGTSRPWKMNHPRKKNSGKGHRNRNRAKAIYDAKEYGVKNNIGNRVIPWEE